VNLAPHNQGLSLKQKTTFMTHHKLYWQIS